MNEDFEVSTVAVVTPSNNTILVRIWREGCGLYNVYLVNTDLNIVRALRPSFITEAKAEEYAREWITKNWNR